MASMEDMIATCALTLELPEELVALLGSPETAAAKAREALVLTLLREGQISQGKVARLLGLTRWDILDLMVQHQIPSGPATPEELRQEVEDLHRFVQSKNQRACHQQQ